MVDINTVSKAKIKKDYLINYTQMNKKEEYILPPDDMEPFFDRIISERGKNGPYLSVKSFIERMFPIIESRFDYPCIMFESFIMGLDIRFPDGNSDNLKYALLFMGHDSHDELNDFLRAEKSRLIKEMYDICMEIDDDAVPF